jgi:hypothetical protein
MRRFGAKTKIYLFSAPAFQKDKDDFLGKIAKENVQSNESQCIYTPCKAIRDGNSSQNNFKTRYDTIL